jgi:hypothetical protein
MISNALRQSLVIIALGATITINALATILPINGRETGEISDSFDVFFVPAGYVFSIWGLIYMALIAYAVYQALPAQRNNERIRSIDGLFIASSFFNSAWIFAWHYEQFVLSVFLMLGLLASLIGIYLKLDIGRSVVPTAERWLVQVPFSIYLGWITVATVANVTSALDWVSWNRFGLTEEFWFVATLAIATIIVAIMTLQRQDIAYLGVIIWAYVGIANKFADVSVIYTSTLIATVVVVGLLIYSIVKRIRPKTANGQPVTA